MKALLCSFYLTSDRTVNQLDISHWSIIACTETTLQNPQVTTITGCIALTQVVEKLAYGFF
jgi:hypothetical protein